MKILYHHRVGSRDGQAVHVDEIIHALRSRGHEVTVVAPPGFEQSTIGEESALAAYLKRWMPQFVYEFVEIAYNLPAYFRLRRAARRSRPELIYERYGLFLIAGMVLSARMGIPLFLEVNSPLARERAEFGGLALKRLARWTEILIWRRASRVLPVTGVLAEMVRSAGVPTDRITVIPNGINPDRFSNSGDVEGAKAAIGLSGKIVLGFSGFIRSWHGLESVVEILARPDAPDRLHLLIVGDGPARADLERRAADLKILDRITFAGLVERDEIARIVGAFDIALQPRAVDYASPLKLFEYMALSKAIVAPNQPNIREILSHEVNALLFDPQRPNHMAAAITRLARDANLRERLGNAARTVIDESHLTWDSNAQRILVLAEAETGRELISAPRGALAESVLEPKAPHAQVALQQSAKRSHRAALKKFAPRE